MVIQTREIKTMVDLISFQLKKIIFSLSALLKQIMTGPSGNRLSICPIEIQDHLPKTFSWGDDPESLGANRSAYYPRDQSLFV